MLNDAIELVYILMCCTMTFMMGILKEHLIIFYTAYDGMKLAAWATAQPQWVARHGLAMHILQT